MQVDVIIVGAGAAGIGAAKAADRLGLNYLLLEASHRIGGRAYTESPTPGIQFDLGCHWLHSASRNPFTQLLNPYGMHTSKWEWHSHFYKNGGWLDGTQGFVEFEANIYETMKEMARQGQDLSVAELYDRDSEWASFYDYVISLLTSVDPDQVTFRDLTDYTYTGEGEDWPVKEGYGTLITRFGSDVPVKLNTQVTDIDLTGKVPVVQTQRGDIRTGAVIITVSTGLLNADAIRFKPELPQWKRQAIHNLQLGNHNRICLIYDRNVFGDHSGTAATWMDGDEVPMYFEIRPFGQNYAVGSTGGRFADWLEKAGQEASTEYAREKLMAMFGSEAGRNITKTVVTAWRGDPWIRGAYSATTPGSHGARKGLARPVEDRLFFAGEATSLDFMDTAHGAYISGVRAAREAALALSVVDPTQEAEQLAWLMVNEAQDKPYPAGAQSLPLDSG